MTTESSDSTPLLETRFAPILLVSIGLLTIVLSGGSSISFGFGIAAGRFLTSIAISLPLFLAIRYGTRRGRRLIQKAQLSLLCLLISAMWLIQIALMVVLPYALPSSEVLLQKMPNSVNNLPECKGLFDDVLGLGCQYKGSSKDNNPFDKFDVPKDKP
jgi:hypothetical protein